jgi:hypothetical protein
MAALVFSKPGYHAMNIIAHLLGHKLTGAAGGKLIKPFQNGFMGRTPMLGLEAETD